MVTSTMQDGIHENAKAGGFSYFLPKGSLKVMGVWNATTGFWDVTAASVIGPDPSSKPYRVERRVNAFFDDDLTIAADPTTGLLQTVNGTTTDQRVNAVASLAAAAVSAYGVPAAFAPAAARAEGALPQLDKKKFLFATFQSVLDPTNADHLAYVRYASSNQVLYAQYEMNLTKEFSQKKSGITLRAPCKAS